MSLAIFVPTMYRAHNLQRLFDSINATTKCDIFGMCPMDDYDSQNLLGLYCDAWWADEGDMRYVKRIEFMYHQTTADWFLTGSDDIVFHDHWLTDAIEYMEDYSVIGFEDLCNPNLPGTNFLIRRKYIEEQSGVIDSPNTVFHQGYFHNFCDNELVGTAKKRDEFAKCPGVIEHRHHTVGKADNDHVYDIAQQHFHQDAELCHSREHLWSS